MRNPLSWPAIALPGEPHPAPNPTSLNQVTAPFSMMLYLGPQMVEYPDLPAHSVERLKICLFSWNSLTFSSWSKNLLSEWMNGWHSATFYSQMLPKSTSPVWGVFMFSALFAPCTGFFLQILPAPPLPPACSSPIGTRKFQELHCFQYLTAIRLCASGLLCSKLFWSHYFNAAPHSRMTSKLSKSHCQRLQDENTSAI